MSLRKRVEELSIKYDKPKIQVWKDIAYSIHVFGNQPMYKGEIKRAIVGAYRNIESQYKYFEEIKHGNY